MANVRGLCRRLRASYGRAAENEDLQKWRSQERLAPCAIEHNEIWPMFCICHIHPEAEPGRLLT